VTHLVSRQNSVQHQLSADVLEKLAKALLLTDAEREHLFRIARHLWRMCFAWFIASASIFLARPHLFPTVLRKTGALYFLSILPLIFMIFWLIRVFFKSRRNLHEVKI